MDRWTGFCSVRVLAAGDFFYLKMKACLNVLMMAYGINHKDEEMLIWRGFPVADN